jgi:hypothetical protein
MKPFTTTIGINKRFIIIPESEAHMDGHPILTYSYNIYTLKETEVSEQVGEKESELHLKHESDPDYFGVINFEQPGRCFNYISGMNQSLSGDEVEELIEIINHYRDTPSMWLI